MSKPKIAVIIGTIREGRFGDRPAQWIFDLAVARADMTAEIVDLRDYPLPLFDAPVLPSMEPPKNEVARRLGANLAQFDGYIFITAEYNHGPSGVLKNALDYLKPQFAKKPAAFVGCGGVGGARAVEQLRLYCVEMRMAPLRDAVHIAMADLNALREKDKTLRDFPHLTQFATILLDELAWWARVLKGGRES